MATMEQIHVHITSYRVHKGSTLVRLLFLHNVLNHTCLSVFAQFHELLPLYWGTDNVTHWDCNIYCTCNSSGHLTPNWDYAQVLLKLRISEKQNVVMLLERIEGAQDTEQIEDASRKYRKCAKVASTGRYRNIRKLSLYGKR